MSPLRIVRITRTRAQSMTKATMTRKTTDSVPWIMVLRTIARWTSMAAGSVSVSSLARASRCCWK